MKDIYKNYKKFIAISRKQRKFVKDNFSLDIMTEEFTRLMNDEVLENLPEQVKLNLPKLKFPNLEKING